MRNVADSVANEMAAALTSPQYRSLFKSASAEDDKDHKHSDECECDDVSLADDKEKEDEKDEAQADTSSGQHKDPSELYGLNPSTAFDVAIDSLLTASAALDTVGMEKSSTLSLKLASLVVEAKKSGQSAKSKVSKEMKKQDKELDKTRLKEEKDAETKAGKAMEKKEKEKIQKGKDRAKGIAGKEMAKKDKAEKSNKVKAK